MGKDGQVPNAAAVVSKALFQVKVINGKQGLGASKHRHVADDVVHVQLQSNFLQLLLLDHQHE